MAKVHLVLGSGGARGIAHIGVIEELEKDGHEIIEVIGCSMGAVVGGIYSAGYLTEYRDWLLTLNKSAVWRLLDFTFTRQGFLKGEKVFDTILNMTGPLDIENLRIPFTAVATEMHNREEVIIRNGDLFQALRASISIPGIFTPVKHDHEVLVDGGVLNPLPLNLVKRRDDAIVVAVNINARKPQDANPKVEYREKEPPEEPKGWLPISWPFTKKNAPTGPPSFSLIDLMQTSYDYTQDRLTELMIKHYSPDITVDIPRTTCGTFEFYRAKELIDLGQKSYQKAIDRG